MTSSLAAFGLRPARMRGANPNSMGLTRYRINPAGLAGSIYRGDPVFVHTNGYIAVVSTSTGFAQGVFMGCYYNDPTTKRPTWSAFYPANTSVGTDPAGITALVMDSPDQTFVIQADASVSVGDVGYNFDVSIGAGSTLTGNSTTTLRAGQRKAGSGLVRVLDLFESPDNAFSDAFTLVEVQFVQHALTRVSAA